MSPRLATLLAFILAIAVHSSAFGDVQQYECAGPTTICIRIHGTIEAADLAKVKAIASMKAFIPSIALESLGGDIATALEISEFLRKRGGYTAVVGTKCHSACVLILAGASRRLVFGAVGIHRPYADSSTGRNTSQIRNDQEFLQRRIKAFLEVANVPTYLADVMFSVPSGSLRLLDKSELTTFLLNQDDPSLAQRDLEASASWLNTTVSDVLQRRARASNCTTEHCAAAAFLGISESELFRRRALATSACKENMSCTDRVMKSGRL
jgi:hypothetical protein